MTHVLFYVFSHIKKFKKGWKIIYSVSLIEKFWLYESQALCPTHNHHSLR